MSTQTATPARSSNPTAQSNTPDRPSLPPMQPLAPTKTRTRPWLVGLGVAIVIVGGLGTWYFASTIGHTSTVLVTANGITRGEVLTAQDLTTLEIASGQNTTAVAATESSNVIGKTAAVDLPAGTMLTNSNIGDALAIEAGQSIVGVALSSAQLPSYQLAAGDKVRLVDTPISQGDPPAATPSTFKAVVFTTKYDEVNGQWIIDLVVPSNQAADIAARSATGRIALVLDSGTK